ncbi:UNVERIFIED_CONTAM: hypothetical protein GTU68_060645 [Idotea baltica]|nr:hypothetical protein [Idotea baltica]
MSDEIEQHGTAEICDLHPDEVRIIKPGFFHYGGKTRCSGKIVTVQLTEDNRTLKALLQTPGEGRIAVVDVAGAFCAVVGDNLASYAIEYGWSEILVNGYIRGVKALSSMPIAVWALGSCPRRSEKRAGGRQGVTLQFGAVRLSSGDFLYADEDGILVSAAPFKDISFKE